MRISKNLQHILAAATVAALFAGCALYQLGTTLPPHLRTVSLTTFKNVSDEPQIETTIASETLREFQRDGQLRIKDADEADILLTGEILLYRLDPVRADRNNPKSTLEYKAIIQTHVIARERKTGKVIVDQTLTGNKNFDGTGDLMSARRNVLPEVSRDLARKIVDAVISAW